MSIQSAVTLPVRQYRPGVRWGAGKPSMSHKGVDGRGRYGNEVGNSLRNKRDEPMGEEGGCKPKEYIRGGQGLAEG